jgi:peroxiredoxin (alkyl hydroperoxide reductase subunit C)
LAWRKTDRKDGGLGHIDIPLVADITKEISAQYNVLVDNP